MGRENLHERLIQTFLAELDERVRAFNADLLALERLEAGEERAPLVASLFRGAHSLKGAARSVGLAAMESLCHGMESLLASLRDQSREPTREIVETLFAALDAIQANGNRLKEGQGIDEESLALAKARLLGTSVPPEVAFDHRAASPVASPSPGPKAPLLPSAGRAEADMGYIRVRADKLDALLAFESDLLAMREIVRAWPESVAELRQIARRLWNGRRPGRPFHGAAMLRGAVATADGTRAPEGLAGEESGRALRALEDGLASLGQSLSVDGRRIGSAADAIAENLLRLRMVPFAEACEGLPRIVRDIAAQQGKQASLAIEGESIELDGSIVQGLRDALLHLVRNAVQHGIAPPEARRMAGRPQEGRITIRAELRGNHVAVSVEDDGEGLHMDAIRDKARSLDLPEAEDDQAAVQLIFLAGFSTASELTAISGRGVGLDIVKTRAESLHGTVSVASRPGSGTRFELSLPLTLLVQRGLVLTAGAEWFVLLESAIRRVLLVERKDFLALGNTETVPFEGARLPVVPLAHVLGVDAAGESDPAERVPVVAVAAGERRIGLVIEGFSAVENVVVKGVSARFGRLPLVSGAAELSNGRVALVLNSGALIAQAIAQAAGGSVSQAREVPAPHKARLVLAEDSLTTRTLMKSLLESAGYQVLPAADGNVAWRLIQEQPVDLVVSDIEMPECTGFELLQRIRESRQFKSLPVVLLTALESDQDRMRGMELGASAYLLKRAFDQTQLIETIRQWL